MAKIRELCALIHSKYDSESEFARKLGWDRRRLNKITTGVKEPDLQEAAEIASGLDTSITCIANIFLHNQSPNRQHRMCKPR